MVGCFSLYISLTKTGILNVSTLYCCCTYLIVKENKRQGCKISKQWCKSTHKRHAVFAAFQCCMPQPNAALRVPPQQVTVIKSILCFMSLNIFVVFIERTSQFTTIFMPYIAIKCNKQFCPNTAKSNMEGVQGKFGGWNRQYYKFPQMYSVKL